MNTSSLEIKLYGMSKETDIIYFYTTDIELELLDIETLRELGFFQPEVNDGEPYNPTEGWAAHV